jgi:hypothetical protein
MVSDFPLTVVIAVWMRAPELLTVGVVPPLPYPLPYLPPLLVDVLSAAALEVAFGAAAPPVLVLLPQAANRRRPTNASRENQACAGAFEEVRPLCIMLSFHSIAIIRLMRTSYETFLV